MKRTSRRAEPGPVATKGPLVLKSKKSLLKENIITNNNKFLKHLLTLNPNDAETVAAGRGSVLLEESSNDASITSGQNYVKGPRHEEQKSKTTKHNDASN